MAEVVPKGVSRDLLRVERLSVRYRRRGEWFRERWFNALSDVSFQLAPGSTTAIVGETGSGKSTILKAIAGMTEVDKGSIYLDGQRVDRALSSAAQMVFQNPVESLNPKKNVKWIVEEPLVINGVSACDRLTRFSELMDRVGLGREFGERLPSQLSGGEAQRVAIARALTVRPNLLLLDEPVSALDVSVQAKVIELLVELQRELRLSYLFVTHDLALTSEIADRILVLYLGRVVEQGSVREVFTRPRHPYTQALLSAVPGDPIAFGTRVALPGEPPSPSSPPSGCVFRTRCPVAIQLCEDRIPELEPRSGSGHSVACHRA